MDEYYRMNRVIVKRGSYNPTDLYLLYDTVLEVENTLRINLHEVINKIGKISSLITEYYMDGISLNLNLDELKELLTTDSITQLNTKMDEIKKKILK